MGWPLNGDWDSATTPPGATTADLAHVMAAICNAINERRGIALDGRLDLVEWPIESIGGPTSTSPAASDFNAIATFSPFISEMLELMYDSIDDMIPYAMRGAAPEGDGSWDAWVNLGKPAFWIEARGALSAFSLSKPLLNSDNWLILKNALNMLLAFAMPAPDVTIGSDSGLQKYNVTHSTAEEEGSKTEAFLCDSFADVMSDGYEKAFYGEGVGAGSISGQVWHEHLSGAWGYGDGTEDESHWAEVCEGSTENDWEEDSGGTAEDYAPHFSIDPPYECEDIVNPFTEITYTTHRGGGYVSFEYSVDYTVDFTNLPGVVWTANAPANNVWQEGLFINGRVFVANTAYRKYTANVWPRTPLSTPYSAVDLVSNLEGDWDISGDITATINGVKGAAGTTTNTRTYVDASAAIGTVANITVSFPGDIGATGENLSGIYGTSTEPVGGVAGQSCYPAISSNATACDISTLLTDQT